MTHHTSPFTGLQLLRLLAFATACYWLVMTFLMHMPIAPLPVPPEQVLPTDKTVHFVLYAGLATALFLTFEQRARVRPTSLPRTRLVRVALLLAFCAIHGYVEEVTQPLTGRTYDLADFAADCIGASAALAACLALSRFLPALKAE